MLNAAVIGLGVGERHIEGYEADPRCRVVALCDIDAGKLAEVGGRHPGRRLTTNPADILEDPAIQVVSIASYDDAHHAQVMAALAAGKHVFVEKPLCLFQEELDDIVGMLARHPELQMSSNLILRRSPRFMALRQRVDSGSMGRLYYVEGDYNYGRVHKITEGWRGRIPFYSVMHGGGIHLIDLIMWLTEARPVQVTAMANKIVTQDTAFGQPDLIAALLRFDTGMVGKVTANFGCVFPHWHNLSLYGTEASFIHNQLGAAIYRTRDPQTPPEMVQDAYPGTAKGDMIPAFVRAILDGGTPEVSRRDVVDAMSVSLAIERSLQTGQPVDIAYPVLQQP